MPFIHVWSFADDQVSTVFDYFGGVEVRRLEDVRAAAGAACPCGAACGPGGTPARSAGAEPRSGGRRAPGRRQKTSASPPSRRRLRRSL